MDAIKWGILVAAVVAFTVALAAIVGTIAGMGTTSMQQIQEAQILGDSNSPASSLVAVLLVAPFADAEGLPWTPGAVWTGLVRVVGALSGIFVAFWIYRAARSIFG